MPRRCTWVQAYDALNRLPDSPDKGVLESYLLQPDDSDKPLPNTERLLQIAGELKEMARPELSIGQHLPTAGGFSPELDICR